MVDNMQITKSDGPWFLLLTVGNPVFKSLWKEYIHQSPTKHISGEEFVKWMGDLGHCFVSAYPYLLTFTSEVSYLDFLLKWA